MVLLFAFTVAACGSNDSKQSGKTPAASSESQTTEKKEQPKQKANKVSEEAKWNKSDINAQSNGNIAIAANIVKRNKAAIKENAQTVNAAEVMRRPWDYYGKVYKFQGVAEVLQDYPPASDLGKLLGGECCEIVMTADNQETIVDGIVLGSTKGLQEGSIAEIYGYVAGTMEVPNKIGGNFTHLVVIGVK